MPGGNMASPPRSWTHSSRPTMRASKRCGAKANSSPCPTIWRKLLRKSLVIDPHVQKRLPALPREQCADVVLKLLELGNAFGNPHAHSGLGMRKLRADLFECRAGLVLRILFRA